MNASTSHILLQHISKSFGGVTALKDVSLEILSGEIHALLGENGAGKSTLMKILSGAIEKDSGRIVIEGKEVQVRNTAESKKLGIGIIYQEFSLVPDLSVAKNIFLHRMSRGGWIQWKTIQKKSASLLSSLGYDIDPIAKVKTLSVAEQQIVEIAKALSEEPRLLILDEPTAVLGTREVEKLFEILSALKTKGVAIIYISHHLNEIFSIADKVTVLKDGATVKTTLINAVTRDGLIQQMLGSALGEMFTERKLSMGAPCITVEHICYKNKLNNISFSVKQGEIVGMAGLVGSGRTEAAESVFGVHGRQAGTVALHQKRVQIKNPWQAIRAGIGMVNEDRKSKGVLLSLSVSKNIHLSNLKQIATRFGFINFKKEKAITADLINRLQIKTPGGNMLVSNLSGGNQQKVALAKWVNTKVDFLIIDEPTRGVDVGAKREIYKLINELAENGRALLVISSETEELMGLCDRILVMRNGKLAGSLLKEEFSEENILRLALGAA